MSKADPQSMHWAREQLRHMPKFDGKELEAKQVENVWRKRFRSTVDPYGPDDAQRLELWGGHLEDASVAMDWAEQMEAEGKIGTWSDLVKQLEARWLPPDAAEKRKEKTGRWYTHVFDEARTGAMVEGVGGAFEPYYMVWARERIALVAEVGGDGPERVEHTWHVLPITLKGLLSKGLSSYNTVATLCKDIMRIERDRVLVITDMQAAQKEMDNRVAQLTRQVALLETKAQSPTPCAFVHNACSDVVAVYDIESIIDDSSNPHHDDELETSKVDNDHATCPVLHILPSNLVVRTKPYQQWMSLVTDQGSAMARGTADAGSQANVIDAAVWAANEAVLGSLMESHTWLKVANGQASRCLGRWRGSIRVADVETLAEFEVFDSNGAFEVLLGKPWLSLVKATHTFADDCLWFPGRKDPLPNGYPLHWPEEVGLEAAPKRSYKEQGPKPKAGKLEIPAELPENNVAEAKPEATRRSSRLKEKEAAAKPKRPSNLFFVENTLLAEVEATTGMSNEEQMGHQEFWKGVRAEDELKRAAERAERALQRRRRADERAAEERGQQETLQLEVDHSQHLPTTPSPRISNPFDPSRVAEILAKVEIGSDLTESQRQEVKGLVAEFADIFARDLSEVLPVKTHSHKLDIPAGTTFRKRVGQKPLSQAQKDWLYSTLEQMESANIIKRVPNTFPAAVSPTNVVPKPGGTNEPTLEYIQMLANRACEDAGIPAPHPLSETPPTPPPAKEPKFRLVHNFAEVNDVTKIPSFPMGDLAAKQRAVAGYRWINVLDFASGFNALPMEEESIKYTGFYVEGKGHYVYLRMPFGLTGAPTSFCEMLRDALHDLFGDGMEIWMDDVAMATNSFQKGLERLRRLFERCREKNLSLAPTKAQLFMSEALFAGAQVSKGGIQTDKRKILAILEWPEPKSVLEVMGFMGLAGAFRPKIKKFAIIAQPLSDLTRDVRPERRADGKSRKGEYKRALQNAKVELSDEARKAFTQLKIALTTDPVLRAPVYDGRPFIVTSDGSKTGFGAMVAQRWEETDSKGKKKTTTYPIAYASKRTSRTEENYPPFLLEFAALKFGFDSFEQIIMGQEIELETDCKALADLLGNKKLNSTHERWRESIIAHRIRAVRHKPGVENPVCDALSRKWQHRVDTEEGEGREESVDPGWEAYKGLVEEVHLLVEDSEAGKLLKRFERDTYFGDIIQLLVLGTVHNNDTTPSSMARAQKRAEHRAVGFEVAGGKLWRIAGKGTTRAPRVECIPKEEGLALALATHEANGHFGRDLTILSLQERYFWPNLRSDATAAVSSCARCRNFGPKLMNALLAPITRARPFDLICADYLSLPLGVGGYKTILLIIDVYSRFTFAFMTKGAGTGAFTVECLQKVSNMIMTPIAFMSDNGSHFDCREVDDWAEQNNVSIIHPPAYTPSVNGLVEDANKILLGRIRPLGIEEGDSRSWPKLVATAVNQMNDRVLPSLGYTPRELMTGVLTSDRKYEIGSTIRQHYAKGSQNPDPIDINMALAYALRCDGAERALTHARKRKYQFDRHTKPFLGEPGDLVQRYDPRWDSTHSNERKLAPKWSGPLRIREQHNASYVLEDLEGNLVSLGTHAKHLRKFTSPQTSSQALAS